MTSTEFKAAYDMHRAAGEKEAASAAWAGFRAAKAQEDAIATREWADKRMDRRAKVKAAAAVVAPVAVKAPSHMYAASTGGGWYDSCAAADDEENGRPAGYSARHSF